MNPPEIGRPTLIMEFVDGISLSDYLLREGPLTPSEARALLKRLASGLERAHSGGVIHRDLSPDNVILAGGQVAQAKLIDFGIAKSTQQGDHTLFEGQFAGKFHFVAPEQLGAHGGEINERTDIYGLGLLIAAACRGRNLEMGKTMIEALRARSSPPDLSDMPPALQPLLRQMLEPDPSLRPASMAAVLSQLAQSENRLRAPTPPPPRATTPTDERAVLRKPPPPEPRQTPLAPAPPPQTAERQKPRGLARGLLFLSAIAALTVAALMLYQRFFTEPPPSPTQATLPDSAPPPRNDDALGRQLTLIDHATPQPCSYLHVLEMPQRLQLIGYSNEATAFEALRIELGQESGIPPPLPVHLLLPPQCPILTLMNKLRHSPEAAPVLQLSAQNVAIRSGQSLTGQIEGLNGRALVLFLINGAGGAANLKPWLRMEGDDRATFSVTVNLAAGAPAAPQLLLALVSPRPLPALDNILNGTSASALVPFITQEAARAELILNATLAQFQLTP